MHSSTYGQVAHNYDKEETNTATADEVSKDEEPDELFVPNPKFFIPEDIELVISYRIYVLLAFFNRFCIFILARINEITCDH